MLSFKENVMTEIKKQIADALCAAAGGALDAETLCAAFEYPPSADMGDLAFPCAPCHRGRAGAGLCMPGGGARGGCRRLSQLLLR